MDEIETVDNISLSRSLKSLYTDVKFFEGIGVNHYYLEKRGTNHGAPWFVAVAEHKRRALLCPCCGGHFWPEDEEQSLRHWEGHGGRY